MVEDQLTLCRICCIEKPCLSITDAEADLELWALYRAMSMPALPLVSSSHFKSGSRVEGFTS